MRQPKGKYELIDGVIVMQQAEKWSHAKVKFEVALREAIKRAGAACYLASDGPTVGIGSRRAFVPDALVAALAEPSSESLEIANPIIIVEALSPSTARMDVTTNLRSYFKVQSVQYSLVVDPDERTIIHRKRGKDAAVRARLVRRGALALHPPAIKIELSDVFGPAAA